VHLASGVWGVLAVGLLDDQEGLFIVGSSDLLRTQAVGCAALLLLPISILTPMALLVHRFGMLRVTLEVEARGLDSKFGITAVTHDSAKQLRLKEAASVIHHYGFTPDKLIIALNSLRHNIVCVGANHRSLSPRPPSCCRITKPTHV
jgi:hypothetical protein